MPSTRKISKAQVPTQPYRTAVLSIKPTGWNLNGCPSGKDPFRRGSGWLMKLQCRCRSGAHRSNGGKGCHSAQAQSRGAARVRSARTSTAIASRAPLPGSNNSAASPPATKNPKPASKPESQAVVQMRVERDTDDVSKLCSFRNASAARSPIMTQGAMVLPVVTRGIIEPSAMRRFSIP